MFETHRILFAKNARRSLRKRVYAALRMAHRVMGMKNKRLGLGALGVGGRIGGARYAVGPALMLSAMWLAPAAANTIATDGPVEACDTGSSGIVGRTNPGGTAGQATDGTGTYSTAAGCNASAAGMSAGTIYGAFSKATEAGGTAIGFLSLGRRWATGIGLEAQATATGATTAGGAVAIGLGQKAIGDGAVAIGDPNVANGTGAVALGANNTAAGNTTGTTAANGAVALGNANFAVGQGSVSLGNQSNAAAAGALAFGDKATGAAANAVALGSGSNAGNANDVALGAGSTTAAVVNTPSGTINGTSYNYAGNAANSTVSVGSSGKERTITNVAAGRISGTSTDAVNGSQLFATNQAVNAIGTSVTTIGNNVNNLADAMVKHNDPAVKNKITLGNAGAPVTIGNVANRIAVNDPVNVGQLDAASQIANKGWNLSTNNGSTTANVAPSGTVDLNNTDGNIVISQSGSNASFGNLRKYDYKLNRNQPA
ncbi:hypothetical protein ACETRX_30850 [Labrys portucalensis]|uniref:Calcium-binding protein n=1 Tax=Labrys neptuniae TaxID=376174 RepID=A0ABV6ZPE2_9HYPH